MLDAMDLERERGITIKTHPVTLTYQARDGQTYELNLIDTPGHVDFSSEVSRSLAACEGALLVIDAAQGVEAQTLANYHLALEHDLTIIPVINKIDLPSADPDRIMGEIEDLLVIDRTRHPGSAKEGIGIEEILEAIVARIPPPKGHTRSPARPGLRCAVRPLSRRRVVRAHRRRRAAAGHEVHVDGASAGLRVHRSRRVQAGDAQDRSARGRQRRLRHRATSGRSATSTSATRSPAPTTPRTSRCAGYRPAVPMVYCGLYPERRRRVRELRDALEKLKLNDAALAFTSRRVRSRSGSGSAAASSACCTWRSSKSGSSATTTST